jgi:predicted  nucleic acid-binding Zn ribbon protein
VKHKTCKVYVQEKWQTCDETQKNDLAIAQQTSKPSEEKQKSGNGQLFLGKVKRHSA